MVRWVRPTLLPTAMSAIAVAWASAAPAQEFSGTAEGHGMATKVELIDSSRLGCGERTPLWTANSGGTQCAFDNATRGLRLSTRDDFEGGSIEAYATVAHGTSGAFTPDRLLVEPRSRSSETTNFVLAGIKASILNDRLKLTAEVARTDEIVDKLIDQDWALGDSTRSGGNSALIRVDATLADRPDLKVLVTGEYRSVSEGYTVGRSFDLSRYMALPGTRLSLSTKARIAKVGLRAGIEQSRTPFGTSSGHKAGADFNGISLTYRSREFRTAPIEGSTLLDSKTSAQTLSLDVDTALLATWLLPSLGELPWLIPETLYVSVGRGEADRRYETSADRYAKSSLGINGIWQTPVGETGLNYWRDTRTWLTGDERSRSSETFMVDHSIRRGNWRFGVDAMLTQSRGDGSNGFSNRSLSFGQSVAYSAKDGPELRISLGQDRGTMRLGDDSYVSADSYSRITASLDLSKYLQKRFERDDLRLTLDYRKVIDRSESEISFEEELIDRWVDGDRREGFLMSFGMKL